MHKRLDLIKVSLLKYLLVASNIQPCRCPDISHTYVTKQAKTIVISHLINFEICISSNKKDSQNVYKILFYKKKNCAHIYQQIEKQIIIFYFLSFTSNDDSGNVYKILILCTDLLLKVTCTNQ